MKIKAFPGPIFDLTSRGNFLRVTYSTGYAESKRWHCRYYYRWMWLRVPWLAWAMFS